MACSPKLTAVVGPSGPCTRPITGQPYPHNLHQRIWRKSTWNLELRGSNSTTATSTNNRHNEDLRRLFLRPADLPRQGTDFPSLRLRPTARSPTPEPSSDARNACGTRMTPHGGLGGKSVDGTVGEEILGQKRGSDDALYYRVSCTSVATARSSGSRTANPSPSSSSARTPAALPGPSSTGDSTARVSLRYAISPPARARVLEIAGNGLGEWTAQG